VQSESRGGYPSRADYLPQEDKDFRKVLERHLCIITNILCVLILCSGGKICDADEKVTKTAVKMDAYTLSELSKYEKNERVDLFIMTKEKLSPDEIKKLKSIGCTIRSLSSNALTVNIMACNVDELIKLDFIEAVELPKQLNLHHKRK